MNLNEISKGVTLITESTDKFMTSYVSVSFLNPLKNPDNSYFALIPFVLKRGTEKYPDMTALNRKTDELYGASVNVSVQKKGDFQAVSLGIKFIRNSCTLNHEDLEKECLDLLFDIIFSPNVKNGAFDKDTVNNEKANLIDLIKGEINDKRSYAIKRCVEIMFEGKPFGLNALGEIGEIEKIDEKSLYEQYLRFINNSQIIAFAEGNNDFKLFEALVKEKFPPRDVIKGLNTDIKPPLPSPTIFEEKMEINQGKLSLGFTTGILPSDEDYPSLLLLNCIYGGSPNSKLFENVREKLSLCYYCASRLDSLKALMLVYSGVEFDKKDDAYNEILKQLKFVVDGEISDDEIEAAKKAMKNAYSSIADNPFSTESFYIDTQLGGRLFSPDELSELVLSVTKEQVSKVASKIVLDTVYFLKGGEANE